MTPTDESSPRRTGAWLKRPLALATLAIIPPIFAWVSIPLHHARGPFWLGANSDPSYVYLFSSLLLLNGQTPYHTDHPGTPVQILGAIALLAASSLDDSPGLSCSTSSRAPWEPSRKNATARWHRPIHALLVQFATVFALFLPSVWITLRQRWDRLVPKLAGHSQHRDKDRPTSVFERCFGNPALADIVAQISPPCPRVALAHLNFVPHLPFPPARNVPCRHSLFWILPADQWIQFRRG